MVPRGNRLRAALLVGGVSLAVATVPVFADRGSGSGSASAADLSVQAASPGGIPGENGKPWDGKTHLIGDGSTSYTGPQPKQPVATPLQPGQRPPQFVVISWDGALENDSKLFSHYRELGEQYNAQMTFFLTGIYLVPSSKRFLYRPPHGHGVGTAAIDFPTEAHVRSTLEQLSLAWQDGDEIGTHFNGHFCGPGGGGDWSTQEWLDETKQAYSFVENWKTDTGFTDIPALPFDYSKELVGGRAPCLEGQKTLIPAEKQLGWRYDASSPGDFQAWPHKIDGIWNFPLELIPYPNKNFQVLSMDFNFLANQSNSNPQGDPSKFAGWQQTTVQGYLNGFNRAYYGSRAPLFIGNHFEDWNGGIYMKSIDQVIKTVCTKPEVRCVSFKEMADWLDAQSPAVLTKLRSLDPGEAPDWSTFITAADEAHNP
ncbi:hypothetical protein [Streptacidiphilus pinicola]|nr:hypothetical protein [Streptacidiphilus pinicola]